MANGTALHRDRLARPVPKSFRWGTQRSVPPSQTVERVRPFLGEMGITRIADVTGLDRVGIPVTMVCRPNSRSVSVSQGKGLTLDAAKASGVMESIELFHAETITLPLKLATYAELISDHEVVDVADLPLIAGGRFHPDLQMLWIEGRDLMADADVWVPFEMVNLSTSRPEMPAGSFISSSNGLASGNQLIEAVLHGICEVVERDATTLWHLRSPDEQQSRRVALETVQDEGNRRLLEMCERAGLEVVAWDISSDVGLAACQCLIFDRDEELGRDLYAALGMGAHLSPEIAFLRALTEAAQSRLTLIAGARDDVFREEYDEKALAAQFLGEQRALLRNSPPTRSLRETPSLAAETFNDDLAVVLERLQSADVRQVIAVDLTKSRFEIPVVRIIIPGLETFDKNPDYSPGRRARAFAGDQISRHQPSGHPL